MKKGGEEIRCRRCGKLLAVRYPSGIMEIKMGRLIVLTQAALFSCPKCGQENGEMPGEGFFGKCLTARKRKG